MTTFRSPSADTEPGIGALTFGGFLDELAARFGERPALLAAPAGGARIEWTYSDLRRNARAVAKALVAAGVSRGTRVGVLMANRPEWVAAVWGAAMAGGVAVPFNTFAQPRELDHLLRHSDAAVVLIEAQVLRHRFADDILELCPEARTADPGRIRSGSYPFLRRIVSLDGVPSGAVQSWDAFLAAGASVPDAVIDGIARETVPSEDGIIIYSSGTTSVPKGVLHRHRAPMLQCWRHAARERYTPEDRVYCGLPLFWTAGFAAVLGATLASGACLVMPSHFDPEDALRLIEQERVTVMQCVPSHDASLQACQARARRDLSSLRRDSHRITGEPAPAGSSRPANQASYGSSETFTSITALPNGASPEECATYGRLIAGSSMRILDPESGAPLGPAEEGEIILKGLTLMRGYVKTPPEDSFDEEGYFHTGDTGWFDEHGLLHFTGRMTSMIRTSGANVAPLEVEEVLLTHPEVSQAVVVSVPDPIAGELVVGCIIPRGTAILTEEQLRDHLRRSLSSFKVPRRILFFAEHELPRTGSDKFNVPAVRALAVGLLAAGR
jgi:fatty-acyl-CoA synthase